MTSCIAPKFDTIYINFLQKQRKYMYGSDLFKKLFEWVQCTRPTQINGSELKFNPNSMGKNSNQWLLNKK